MAAMESSDEECEPCERVLGNLLEPSIYGCKLGVLYNDMPDTILFERLLREFLDTNPENNMVSLMWGLMNILAEVRNQSHEGIVPTSWKKNLWGAIGIGENSILYPFRQISGLERNGAFSIKLRKLVNSLTENENMVEYLKNFHSQPAIMIEP
jgi:hypothetical protein